MTSNNLDGGLPVCGEHAESEVGGGNMTHYWVGGGLAETILSVSNCVGEEANVR